MLSHFEILQRIGEGGMGVVYKARDTQLDRVIAIKLLHPDKLPDDERRQRFLQEARAVSALNHPGIVTIYQSPDGQVLYFQKFNLPGLWRMAVGGGEETKVADMPSGVTWYLFGDSSYWLTFAREPEVRRIDHATGRETLVRKLPQGTMMGTQNFAVSADGSRIMFIRLD